MHSIAGRQIEDLFEIEVHGELPVLKPRSDKKFKLLDIGLVRTGICKSAIGLIDEEKPELSYRGKNVIELANNCSFTDVVHLLITGRNDSAGSIRLRQHILDIGAPIRQRLLHLKSINRAVSITDLLILSVISSQGNA